MRRTIVITQLESRDSAPVVAVFGTESDQIDGDEQRVRCMSIAQGEIAEGGSHTIGCGLSVMPLGEQS